MVSTAVDSQTRRPLPDSQALEKKINNGGLVKDGAHGQAVSEAQDLLKAHGFAPGAPDGKMGQNTHDAVVKFQTSRGIKKDGIIGPETLRELRTPTTGVDRRQPGVDRGTTPAPQ